MKKLIVLCVLSLFFISCEKSHKAMTQTYTVLTKDRSPIPVEKIALNDEYKIKVYVIDNCEYIGDIGFGNYSYLAHKGNCKFCIERNKK